MTESQNNADPSLTPAWKLLQQHAQEMSATTLAAMLAEPGRSNDFCASFHDLFVDYSRYRATPETLTLLLQLAEQCELRRHIDELFSGATVNISEGRAALHTCLRGPSAELPQAELAVQEQQRFLKFADAVRNGHYTGYGQQPIRRLINIGIGGSDLGPRLLAASLADGASMESPVVEFVAGIDGIELRDALRDADPATTLFVVCSKTFTTLETRENAEAARAWLLQSLPAEAVGSNFVAVTADIEAAAAFGISRDNCFRTWGWVGGRYSVWSAVGLSAAIVIGSESFRELLSGAGRMDEHFRVADFSANIPVLLALLSVWNRNFLGLQHQVVLPYDQRLEKLPAYLQQLFMESLGKSVRQSGAGINYVTGGALWGGVGANAQHSYAQWLHQGTDPAHVDFIASVNGPAVLSANAQMKNLANLVAQADALAYGQAADDASGELDVLHKVHPGNRSSLVILLRELSPFNLGMLIALYEHQVYVQSVIWGINAFDQWGVELGKQRASQVAAALMDGESSAQGRLPELGRQILRWRD